jgi:hypothetical protein
MVHHKRHTLSSGIFDKKYPQPLTHWETERWYARRAKRHEYNKKIILMRFCNFVVTEKKNLMSIHGQ